MTVAKSKAEIEAEKMDFVESVITEDGIVLPLSIEEQKQLLKLVDDASNTLEDSMQYLLLHRTAVRDLFYTRIGIVILATIVIIQSFLLAK